MKYNLIYQNLDTRSFCAPPQVVKTSEYGVKRQSRQACLAVILMYRKLDNFRCIARGFGGFCEIAQGVKASRNDKKEGRAALWKITPIAVILSFIFGMVIFSFASQNITLDTAQYNLALNLYIQRRYSASIVEFKNLISEYPASPYVSEGYFWLGLSYFAKKDYRSAIEYLKKIEINPYSIKYKESIYYLGLVNYYRKSYKESIDYFSKFVKKYPNDNLADNSLYWTGECYYAMENKNMAKKYFKLVIKRYPNGNKVDAARYKLKLMEYVPKIVEVSKPSEDIKKKWEEMQSLDELLKTKELALETKEKALEAKEKALSQKESELLEGAETLKKVKEEVPTP